MDPYRHTLYLGIMMRVVYAILDFFQARAAKRMHRAKQDKGFLDRVFVNGAHTHRPRLEKVSQDLGGTRAESLTYSPHGLGTRSGAIMQSLHGSRIESLSKALHTLAYKPVQTSVRSSLQRGAIRYPLGCWLSPQTSVKDGWVDTSNLR